MVSEPARFLRGAPTAGRLSWLRDDLDTVTWWLLRAFALSIPFSIFVSQLFLVLTTVAATIDWWRRGRPLPRTPLDWPIACFALASLLAALLGLAPLKSLYGMRTYLQVVVIYLVYAYARDIDRSLSLARCLLVGMAVTSAYRVLAALSPIELPRLFLGQMTQSGQLLFAVALALPLLLRRIFPVLPLRFALVLYVVALILNLKRGVWLGAAAAVMIVGLLGSRRLVVITGLAITVALAVVPPVRARVANSARDLFLPGNRYDIWVSALDVVRRFPMGVGRKNGEILRDYPNIPQHHKHAHNNFLQITLEGGFLGLGIFLWWMVSFGTLAWRAYGRVPPGDRPLEALAIAILASFVGFHAAGLVEYNFGDSEVLQIFFVMMGLGLIVNERTRRSG